MSNQLPIQPLIVRLPTEIDGANHSEVYERLSEAALPPGVTVVIADMTATTFCDSAGFRILVRTHERAAVAGPRLRLAVAEGEVVARLLELLDPRHMLEVYPSVELALVAQSAS